MPKIDELPQIQSLNEEEKKLFYEMVRSSKKPDGSLDLTHIQDLWDVDYDEVPVTVDQFIEDEYYMGLVYDHGNSIYPFWRKFLHDLFHNNPDKAFEVAITGAIGTGKSTIATIALSYLMYRTLCLKNPQKFYGLTANSPIVFMVFNLTLELAYSGLYSMIVEAIRMSPWFKQYVDIRGKYEFTIEFPKGISLIAGSQTTHSIGRHTCRLSRRRGMHHSCGVRANQFRRCNRIGVQVGVSNVSHSVRSIFNLG